MSTAANTLTRRGASDSVWDCQRCLNSVRFSSYSCPECGTNKDDSRSLARIKIPFHPKPRAKDRISKPQPAPAHKQNTNAKPRRKKISPFAEPDFQFTPIVTLTEVHTSTGEEEEEILFSAEANLYIKYKDVWLERGVGTAKILRHRNTGAVRFLMRAGKTLRICANHSLCKGMQVRCADENRKTAIWISQGDMSDDGQREHCMFQLRFKSDEPLESFRMGFEAATIESAPATKHNTKAAPRKKKISPFAEPDFQFTPIVTLTEVHTSTGEEEEEVLFSDEAKLHIREEGVWLERGVGTAKILRHRTTGAARFLMRIGKTHRICANHNLSQGMPIRCADDKRKAVFWIAQVDMSDDKKREHCMFLLRVKSDEQLESLKKGFEKATSEPAPAHKHNTKEKPQSEDVSPPAEPDSQIAPNVNVREVHNPKGEKEQQQEEEEEEEEEILFCVETELRC